MSQLPRIAITMGDPAGVGPELCLRMLADSDINSICRLVVIGDADVFEHCSVITGLAFQAKAVELNQWRTGQGLEHGPLVVDMKAISRDRFQYGSMSAETGLASYRYIDLAIDEAMAGRIDGVTTGPISKEALHLAGIHFPGHTEIFATRSDASRSCMMQYSSEITCTFVTVHVGYAEVPGLLTVNRITDVIDLTVEALKKIRRIDPKIVVCGLNPHAGEHGLFGNREEELVITPAIVAARARGIQIEGPLPPDTAFLPSKRKVTDAFVCMYHDQGHIPVKALAFDSAVNTTLGLPIVRTSVDHGTAFDIAWQGVANPGSMKSAIRLAAQLAQSRSD